METTAKKSFSKIGFSYLMLGITSLIAEILIFNIVGPYVPEILIDKNLMISISALCTYIIPIPVFLSLMRKIPKVTIPKKSLGLQNFLICFCITMFLMYVGNLIGLEITEIIGNFKHSAVPNPVSELISNSSIWINIFLITIIGPIFEEIFFRKILIDRTIRYGPKISILLSGLLFGLFHGNLNQFFYAFFMGSFFAFIYIKTGKIIYPIALHILTNLQGSVISLFASNQIEFATIYSIIILAIVLLGVIFSLLNYEKLKTLKNYIKKPLKTSILNWGMMSFIAVYIIEIVLTTI